MGVAVEVASTVPLTTSDGTWVAVAMSLIAVLSTIAGHVKTYAEGKDRRKYSRELLTLKTQLSEKSKQHAEMQESLDRCQADHEESRRDRQAMREEISRMALERQALVSRINELERLVSDKATIERQINETYSNEGVG